LPDAAVADIVTWIDQGPPWPLVHHHDTQTLGIPAVKAVEPPSDLTAG
jgi:hypothetical protein